jgi:hypothetical protein
MPAAWPGAGANARKPLAMRKQATRIRPPRRHTLPIRLATRRTNTANAGQARRTTAWRAVVIVVVGFI